MKNNLSREGIVFLNPESSETVSQSERPLSGEARVEALRKLHADMERNFTRSFQRLQKRPVGFCVENDQYA